MLSFFFELFTSQSLASARVLWRHFLRKARACASHPGNPRGIMQPKGSFHAWGKEKWKKRGGGVTLKITCSWKVECAHTSKLGSFFDFFFWRGKGRFRGQENWYSYRFIINWCSADLSFNFSSGLTGPISIRTFRICVWLFVLWYLYLFLKYCYSCYVQYK